MLSSPSFSNTVFAVKREAAIQGSRIYLFAGKLPGNALEGPGARHSRNLRSLGSHIPQEIPAGGSLSACLVSGPTLVLHCASKPREEKKQFWLPCIAASVFKVNRQRMVERQREGRKKYSIFPPHTLFLTPTMLTATSTIGI